MTALLLRHAILHISIFIAVTATALASQKLPRASSPLDCAITVDLSRVPLRQALSEIESKAGVKFGYSDALIDSVDRASLHVQDRSVSEFLPKFLENLNIAYKVDGDGHITLFKTPEQETFGFFSGYVSDGSSRTPISDATILAVREGQNKFSTISRWDGTFEMRVPAGAYSIRVNGMEFVRNAKIHAGRHARFNIRLKGASFPAVEVYAPTSAKVDRTQFESGFHTLRPSPEVAPHVGTSDLFQDMQALPGVGIFNDYSSKLFVRGSPPGQLLFLLDGVPIEMPYHLFGMAGVINPEITEQVNLSSGVFSARYGDRVGGVVDIQTRTATSQGLSGAATLNPANTSLALRGQLRSNVNILLGGRYSHHNFASRVFRGEQTPYYFGDIYSKLTYRPDSRNRFSVNGFYSRDNFLKRLPAYKYSSEQGRTELLPANTIFSWYSWIFGANWRHDFSASSQLELGYSRSQNFVKDGEETNEIPSWAKDNFTDSYIARQTIRGDLTKNLGASHRVRLGSQLVHHKLRYAWRRLTFQMASAHPVENHPTAPLSIFFESAGDELNYQRDVQQLLSYVEDLWQPFEKLTIETGLRFEKRSFVKDWALAPRINLGYRIGDSFTAKAAYGKFYQGLTTAIDDTLLYMLPLLIPLEDGLELQSANHYLVGVQIGSRGMQFSVEGYYKKIDNQLTFFTTASDTAFQEIIDQSILSRVPSINMVSRLSQGTAANYGVEFGLQRLGPRFNLNLNYLFSYSKQDLPSLAKQHGDFSAADQRHALKAFGRFHFGDGWNLGFRWLLTSGRPMITIVDNSSDISAADNCSPENPCRYPIYHRLDINVSKSFRWSGWKLMAYLQLPDVYRRKDVASLFFYDLDWGQGSQASKRALFPTMPVVPTFGVNIEF